MKKSLAAVAVAGAIVLTGASAAHAYPVDIGCTVSPGTVAVGQSATISCVAFNDDFPATFTVTGPGVVQGVTLTSVSASAVSSASVTKDVVNGETSATFTPPTAAEYEITVTQDGGEFGSFADSLAITVIEGSASGGTGGSGAEGGLPATGGDVPGAALWLGVGALGVGGIAVAAAAARRRASRV
ncbi:hypothetical protein [Microbacterium sp. NPDC077184]|uniref:hypothetical protein n=1 Tax=Microbacterium sp. NPDC077184 TaxID=3154764 RepID=UPI00341EC143